MPVVWGRHNKRQVFINVAVLTAADFALVRLGQAPSLIHMQVALIDTGATGTCISKAAANKVGLSPIGKVQIHGVSGPKYHNNYLFHLGYMMGQPIGAPSPAGTQQVQGQLHALNDPIQGAEFDPGGHGGFDVLLGMDVISIGSFKVEGDGTFSLAF